MVFGLFSERRRERLRAEPFPSAWRAILERNLALFGRLSKEDQDELIGHIQVFLAEKHFEGCGGLELTDDIRVTIAAQACLLLLHRKTDYYPELTSILVYPTGYTADEVRHIGGGVWEEGPEDRLGHTGSRLGALVLAWDAARRGAADPADGYGATNPTEFFAVATEAFFERPRALRATHPKLYAELRKFFRQDPVTFSSEPPG